MKKNQWEDVNDETVIVAVGEQVTCQEISLDGQFEISKNTGKWCHGYPEFDDEDYDCIGGVWGYSDPYAGIDISSLEATVCPNLVKTWDDERNHGCCDKIVCSTHS